MQRHLGDVELVREDQLQQQVERALEVAQPDLKAWLLRLPSGCRLGAHAPNRSMTSRASDAIGLGAAGFRRPRGDRLAGDRGLREPDRAGDHGVEHQVAERSTTRAITSRECRVRGSYIVARMPLMLESGVEPVAHLVDGVDEQRDPAQREELALERDDHAVRAGQRVDGEQAERRLAVDQDVVVVGPAPGAARGPASARGRPR